MGSRMFTPNLTRSASKASIRDVKDVFASAFMNLVNLLVALRRLPPLGTLTGDEERLLFELKALEDSEEALTVSHVYDLLEDKSGSTSYRNLTSLKEKGLVSISTDPNDGRKRFISFTPDADTIFSALGSP